MIKPFAKILLLCIATVAILVTLLFGHSDIPLEELKIKYAGPPSAFTEVNGMEVHYRDEGNPTDSIPIVLIHGTGSSLHTFDAWTLHLSRERRVIRMDLPGYGLTGPFPNRNYSISNFVAFIHEFFTKLGVRKCVIAGNSLGGNIAWAYALEHPAMVDKLILIDAAGYPAESKSVPLAFQLAKVPIVKQLLTYITPRFIAEKSVQNVYADKSKVTDSLVDRYFELTLREGNRQAFVDRFGVVPDTNAHQQIKFIRQETLILWGDQDELLSVDIAQRFHEDLPNDTLVIIENAGHVPMEELPDVSLVPVLDFLNH